MQLTNIARDVGEDARNGRVYLPETWLAEEGLSAASLVAAPRFSPALARVVLRLLDEADGHYQRAEQGIPMVPANCRPAIRAARLIYAEIDAQVRRKKGNSMDQRCRVSSPRKLVLLARAALPLQGERPTGTEGAKPLLANRFMIDAMPAAPLIAAEVHSMAHVPWWNMASRAIPVLSLIERLERADRTARDERSLRSA